MAEAKRKKQAGAAVSIVPGLMAPTLHYPRLAEVGVEGMWQASPPWPRCCNGMWRARHRAQRLDVALAGQLALRRRKPSAPLADAFKAHDSIVFALLLGASPFPGRAVSPGRNFL